MQQPELEQIYSESKQELNPNFPATEAVTRKLEVGAEPVLKLGTLRCGCLKWHHTCYAKLLPIFIVLKKEYEVYQISVTYVKKKNKVICGISK